jgi:hypothetical protein
MLSKRPLLFFLIVFLILALPLCTLPINLFPGEVVYGSGLGAVKIKAPLSLSYFLGFGYQSDDMAGITDYYLTWGGALLAFCFLVGIPAIATYRFLHRNKSN